MEASSAVEDHPSTAEVTRETIRRSRAVVALFVVLVGLPVVLGGLWFRGHSYIWSTRRASLDWSCGNGIFWVDEGRGIRWWAGHDPAPTGKLDTSPPMMGSIPPQRHAEGRLHFTSANRAVFTSDAGGRLILYRESIHAVHTADCSLGFAASTG